MSGSRLSWLTHLRHHQRARCLQQMPQGRASHRRSARRRRAGKTGPGSRARSRESSNSGWCRRGRPHDHRKAMTPRERGGENANFERHQQEHRPGIQRPAAAVDGIVDNRAVPLQAECERGDGQAADQHDDTNRRRSDAELLRKAFDREGRECIERAVTGLLRRLRRAAMQCCRDRGIRRAEALSCRALLDAPARACRTSRPRAPAGRRAGTGKRTSRAARSGTTSPRTSKWNDAPEARHVAMRQRVPDDQDALEPHSDIDQDRRSRTARQRAPHRAETTAPAAARHCRTAAPRTAAHRCR